MVSFELGRSRDDPVGAQLLEQSVEGIVGGLVVHETQPTA
jgi:hypothetical protein